MKCPRCAFPVPDDATECPSCGIIFAKWRELQEKKKPEPPAPPDSLEPSPAPFLNPWIGRTIAGGLIIAWMSALAVYYRHWLAHARR